MPIWVVAVDGTLSVRSYRGATGAWYRHASRHSSGSVRLDGLRRDIAFVHPSDEVRDVIDDAYRNKYARYGESHLRTMLAEPAVAATLRLVPQP